MLRATADTTAMCNQRPLLAPPVEPKGCLELSSFPKLLPRKPSRWEDAPATPSSTPKSHDKPLLLERRERSSILSKIKNFSIDASPRLVERRRTLVEEDVDGIADLDAPDIDDQQSAANTSNSSLVRPDRTVRFQLDTRTQRPVETHFSYPRIPPELKESLFWTSRETKQILKAQNRMAKESLSRMPELIDCIYYLHGLLVESNKKLLATGQQMTVESAQEFLSRSNCRGLERFMTNLISSHRVWAQEQLLNVQDRMWEKQEQKLIERFTRLNKAYRGANTTKGSDHDEASCDDEALTMVLRVWSLKLSAAPTLYAQRVAEADAVEAARYQQQEPGASPVSKSGHPRGGGVVPACTVEKVGRMNRRSDYNSPSPPRVPGRTRTPPRASAA